MLEVTYTLKTEDYNAMLKHTWRKQQTPQVSPWWFAFWWLPWIWLLLMVVVFALLDIQARIIPLAIAGSLLVAIVAFPLVKWWWPQMQAKRDYMEANRAGAEEMSARGDLGRVTLVLTDDTLTERTAGGTSVIRWQDMPGVEVVGHYTFIQVTPELFAIIPRRGSERAEDYTAVRDFALAKLRPLS